MLLPIEQPVTAIEAGLWYNFARQAQEGRHTIPKLHSCASIRNLKFNETGAGVSMGTSDYE